MIVELMQYKKPIFRIEDGEGGGLLVLGTGLHGTWYWDLRYCVLVGVRVVPTTFPRTNFLLKDNRSLHAKFIISIKTKSIKRQRKKGYKI